MKRRCMSRVVGEMHIRSEVSWPCATAGVAVIRAVTPPSPGEHAGQQHLPLVPGDSAHRSTPFGGRIFTKQNVLIPYAAAITQRAKRTELWSREKTRRKPPCPPLTRQRSTRAFWFSPVTAPVDQRVAGFPAEEFTHLSLFVYVQIADFIPFPCILARGHAPGTSPQEVAAKSLPTADRPGTAAPAASRYLSMEKR